MDSRVQRILACPDCKHDLDISGGAIVCGGCGATYGSTPKGIPKLLPSGSQKEYADSADLDSKGFYQGGMLHKMMDLGSRVITTEFRVNSRVFRDEIAGISESCVAIEVGAGRRKLSENLITLDLFAFDTVDIVCDAHSLPIRSASCDFVLLDAVLEHLQRPWMSAAGSSGVAAGLFVWYPSYIISTPTRTTTSAIPLPG